MKHIELPPRKSNERLPTTPILQVEPAGNRQCLGCPCDAVVAIKVGRRQGPESFAHTQAITLCEDCAHVVGIKLAAHGFVL